MKIPGARFINYKEFPGEVKIKNRSRKTVFIGLSEDEAKDNGYPLLAGEVLTIKKPLEGLYVAR